MRVSACETERERERGAGNKKNEKTKSHVRTKPGKKLDETIGKR